MIKLISAQIFIVTAAVLFLNLPSWSIASEPTSATLRREELMPLVFPGWMTPTAPDSGVTSHSPTTKTSSLGAAASAIEQELGQEFDSIAPHPSHVIRLDNDHSVLITVSDVHDANNENICANYAGCAVVIGAYFFGSTAEGWKLTKRVDDIAVEYTFTNAEIRKWPGHGYLLIINRQQHAQGGSRNDVGFVLLQPDQTILSHERSIGIAGDYDGGETVYDIVDPTTHETSTGQSGCQELMRSSFIAPKGAAFDAHMADLCTQTLGKWNLEQDVIRLTYQIRHRTVGPQGELQGIKESTVIVELGIRDGELKVVSGTIPDIETT